MIGKRSKPANRDGLVLSRRALLAGGAAAGGAAVLAGCAPERLVMMASRVDHVPLDDPGANVWKGHDWWVRLDGQPMVLPTRALPSQPAVQVRAIHDGETIGFRLHWEDGDASDTTVAADAYRDACGVLVGQGEGDQALRPMGTAASPVTILHWKADWQRDIEHGRQSVTDVFPNVVVDTYPPLGPVGTAVTPQTYLDAKASQWLPALHVGNPIAAAARSAAVEKLVARGFGTSTSAPTQNAAGWGRRHSKGWDVVLGRPLRAVDEGEIDLEVGSAYTCAFALWSGSEWDRGSRKSPSLEAWILELGR